MKMNLPYCPDGTDESVSLTLTPSELRLFYNALHHAAQFKQEQALLEGSEGNDDIATAHDLDALRFLFEV